VRPGRPGPISAAVVAKSSRYCSGVHKPLRAASKVPVRREPLIHPEQIGLHRCLEVGHAQIGGAAEFSVPGMGEFMPEQACHLAPSIRGQQVSFPAAAVVALVVFEAEMRHVVA
jgi:hypothetical protein